MICCIFFNVRNCRIFGDRYYRKLSILPFIIIKQNETRRDLSSVQHESYCGKAERDSTGGVSSKISV